MLAFLAYFVGLLVVGGLLFLAASFVFGRGEEMARLPVGGTPVELPDDRPVAAEDVRALRLSVVLRGYRMDEVDWVLAQLADQLADRDRELARLRRGAEPEPAAEPEPEPEPAPEPAPAAVESEPAPAAVEPPVATATAEPVEEPEPAERAHG